MPTLKKRINLSVDEALYAQLEEVRKLKQAQSLSAVIIELTKEALELQEDLYFAKLADERSGEETLSHEEVWE